MNNFYVDNFQIWRVHVFEKTDSPKYKPNSKDSESIKIVAEKLNIQ